MMIATKKFEGQTAPGLLGIQHNINLWYKRNSILGNTEQMEYRLEEAISDVAQELGADVEYGPDDIITFDFTGIIIG